MLASVDGGAAASHEQRVQLIRRPPPMLAPFVHSLWVSDPDGDLDIGPKREHLLPSGTMHIVFRLSDAPLQIFRDADDRVGQTIGNAVVGGARATYYVRAFSRPSPSVGAQLEPGAALALFGVRADELAGRHTPLDELWGSAADEALLRLLEEPSAVGRLEILSSVLAARLPRVHGLHPAIAAALWQLDGGSSVRAVVSASGYSHRGFASLFRHQVGLAPKELSRVLRFRRVLRQLRRPRRAMVELALDAGFSDQAHFSREFRALAGVTPGQYLDAGATAERHVPVRS